MVALLHLSSAQSYVISLASVAWKSWPMPTRALLTASFVDVVSILALTFAVSGTHVTNRILVDERGNESSPGGHVAC